MAMNKNVILGGVGVLLDHGAPAFKRLIHDENRSQLKDFLPSWLLYGRRTS